MSAKILKDLDDNRRRTRGRLRPAGLRARLARHLERRRARRRIEALDRQPGLRRDIGLEPFDIAGPGKGPT